MSCMFDLHIKCKNQSDLITLAYIYHAVCVLNVKKFIKPS